MKVLVETRRSKNSKRMHALDIANRYGSVSHEFGDGAIEVDVKSSMSRRLLENGMNALGVETVRMDNVK